jgi:sortase (surface protein transpeptidase)
LFKHEITRKSESPDIKSSYSIIMNISHDIYGEIFRDIMNLKPGMLFDVYTEKQVYTYVVTGHEIVAPQDIQVMGNRRYDRNADHVLSLSC